MFRRRSWKCGQIFKGKIAFIHREPREWREIHLPKRREVAKDISFRKFPQSATRSLL